MAKGWSGKTTREYKQYKGLKKISHLFNNPFTIQEEGVAGV